MLCITTDVVVDIPATVAEEHINHNNTSTCDIDNLTNSTLDETLSSFDSNCSITVTNNNNNNDIDEDNNLVVIRDNNSDEGNQNNVVDDDDYDVKSIKLKNDNTKTYFCKKTNRLISIDSGIESVGKSINSVSDDNVPEAFLRPKIIYSLKYTDKKHNNSECIKIEKFKKNRTTTLNNFDDTGGVSGGVVGVCINPGDNNGSNNGAVITNNNNNTLDPKLINRKDGLSDTLYYIDENGSPKLREKYLKKVRAKLDPNHQLKEDELDQFIIDSFENNEKTASCVSFSKLFKKIRESFRKFFIIYVYINFNICMYLNYYGILLY